MTIKLLSLNECDSLMQFILNEQNKKQHLKEEFFKNHALLRNLIFNSQLIVICDTDGGYISKIFSVMTPTASTNNTSLTITAIYDDANFIEESINLISELLIDEKFTKIKIVNENEFSNDTIRTILSCGFIKETVINTIDWSQSIYSYFLEGFDETLGKG